VNPVGEAVMKVWVDIAAVGCDKSVALGDELLGRPAAGFGATRGFRGSVIYHAVKPVRKPLIGYADARVCLGGMIAANV